MREKIKTIHLPGRPRVKVNVYSKRKIGLVTAYDRQPSTVFGQVLFARIENVGYTPIHIDLFRRIALLERERLKLKGKPHEFTLEDGARVGRYLLDQIVVVEQGKVTEVSNV